MIKANRESDIYVCEACKQVFQDSSFPAQCCQCQSSRIFKTDLEQLTLRQLRQIMSRNTTFRFGHHRRYHSLKFIRQIIPTVKEVKQEVFFMRQDEECRRKIAVFGAKCTGRELSVGWW